MKITIDTKEDSHDDIRRTISFLSTIIDKERINVGKSTNIFESESPGVSTVESSPEQPTGFANMFGDKNDSSSGIEEENSADPGDSPNIMEVFNKEPDNESENKLLDSASSDVNEIQEDQMEKADKPPSFGDIGEQEKNASKLVMEY